MMSRTKIHFESTPGATRLFRTAVSLHSHTLHSREALSFIHRLARRVGPVRAALERGQARYRSLHGSSLDLSRAWWTPPLAPYDAFSLERYHIESRFGVKALISLTDHDDIEAPLGLRVLEECRSIPISVEWTVPFQNTFFHLGIHNLFPDSARELMVELADFTNNEKLVDLVRLLEVLVDTKDTLIVFNHPCWAESGMGQEQHMELATHFVRKCGRFIHALELNGLRTWAENREVLRMARELENRLCRVVIGTHWSRTQYSI
jgi:hypothetical protein